jgi:hypothetical protein
MNDENMRTFTTLTDLVEDFTTLSPNLTDLVADERLSRKDIAEISAAVGYLNGHPGYGEVECNVIEALMESGLSIGTAIDALEPVIRKRTVL